MLKFIKEHPDAAFTFVGEGANLPEGAPDTARPAPPGRRSVRAGYHLMSQYGSREVKQHVNFIINFIIKSRGYGRIWGMRWEAAYPR
jgi:hypothetical protein